MSITVSFNNQTFTLPEYGESGWADQINNYLTAISTGTMQKNTTNFNLLDEMSFGGDYGIKSLYFKSYSTNPSAAGVLRLANTDVIAWRNDTNTSDLTLAMGGSSGLETIVFNNNELLAIPLIKEADFGNSYGGKILYIKSQVSNAAHAGFIRMSSGDSINWRNAGNTADMDLSVSGTDLYWNGSKLNDQSGGLAIPLTSEADFGNSYGSKMLYLASESPAIANEGFLRLDGIENDAITWSSDTGDNYYLAFSGVTKSFYFGTNTGPDAALKSAFYTSLIGSGQSTEGVLRLRNDEMISWRNAANTGNINLFNDWNNLPGWGTSPESYIQIITDGGSFVWLTSAVENPATTGVLRLGLDDQICWRSFDGTYDIPLQVSGSNNDLFLNGSKVLTEDSMFPGQTIFNIVGSTIGSFSTSFREITDLTFAVGDTGQPTHIKFEAYLRYECSTTSAGLELEYEGPTNSIISAEIIIQVDSENIAQKRFPEADTSNDPTGSLSGPNVNSASSTYMAIVRGTCMTRGTAGDFVIRFKSTDDTTNHAYIALDSNCIYTVLQM